MCSYGALVQIFGVEIPNDGQFLGDSIEPSIAVLWVTGARIYCIHWVVTIVLTVTIHSISNIVGAGVVRIGHSGIVEAGAAGMLVATNHSIITQGWTERGLTMKCVVTCTVSRCPGCGICIWSCLEDGCCMNIEV